MTQSAGSPKPGNSGRWIVFAMALLCGQVVRAQPSSEGSPTPADGSGPPNEAAQPSPSAPEATDLLDLDIEQLSRVDVVVPSFDVEVTSVTRSESTVGRSPTAVFVITPEMIRRSGATSLPEVLRMVPGLNVARITSNVWAISSRGFGDQFANKLLVLIDGRTIYTPFFAGVHWDSQDLVLQDIARIEVIRGPGSTVWGANAVNGVINIITKSAAETQGVLISSGGGSEDRAINAVRYGGQVGEDLYFRVYGKQFERDDAYALGGADDDWRQVRGGFRLDWTPLGSDADLITLQGDIYDGESGQQDANISLTPPLGTTFSPTDERGFGEDLLARWTRTHSDTSQSTLQVYHDHWGRRGPDFPMDITVFDVDFTNYFRAWEDHLVTWGLGYRHTDDDVTTRNPGTAEVNPRHRPTDLYTVFVQDEITLLDDELYFMIGSKFEHNDYSGFEYQPGARLLWVINERNAAWASVTRAIRTPSRFEEDTRLTVAVLGFPPLTTLDLIGDRSVEAEDLLAYEAGYRSQPTDSFSWDVALFFNQYDDLVLYSDGTPFFSGGRLFIPLRPSNGEDGETYGLEITGTYQITQTWKLTAWYSFLDIELHQDLTTDVRAEAQEGTAAQNQVFLMSSWDLPHCLEFDLLGRYVDNLPAVDTPHYISLDARVGWRPNEHWELSVVGQNLLEPHRLEFRDLDNVVNSTEVDRGVYAQAVFRY